MFRWCDFIVFSFSNDGIRFFSKYLGKVCLLVWFDEVIYRLNEFKLLSVFFIFFIRK